MNSHEERHLGSCVSPYARLQEKMGEKCEFYTVIAERIGGRELLEHSVKRHFDRSYRGYPTLFIIVENTIEEIPYQPVMWRPSLGRFDPEGIARYIEIVIRKEQK